MTTKFSQLAEPWAPIPLGVGGGHTIGSAGCLMTCGASMLRDRLFDTDPGRLNRWMCRNNGYSQGNLVVFAKMGELAGLGVEVVDCAKRPAPVDQIKAVLDAGGYAIAKVDFRPGGTVQQHWVRVLSVDEDDAQIMDPWLEREQVYWLMPRYGHHTWAGPARAIYRVALYTEGMFSFAPSEAEQEELSIMR